MKYDKYSTEKKIKELSSNSYRYANKLSITIVKVVFIATLVFAVYAASACFGIVMGIIDNAPDVNIDSIVPMGFATNVYDSKGNHIETLVMAGSNREEATYDELPKDLINAFVAIEDSRFWQHKGIDTRSIMRAVKGVLTGDSSSGGGSTITQQLIKNNVFGGGREKGFGAKLSRKLQEQYLAVQLEKTMSKELIITNYLNTINLGNNTLGVKVAARRYFDKDVSELTLSECAVIAGITQNPSKLNPISGKEANEEKRKIILQYMYDQGYITKEQQEEALADPVYDRIQNVDTIHKEEVDTTYSYFTDEMIEQVIDAFKTKLGYSETQAHNMLYSGGLTIYTTQDPDLQTIVDEETNDPSNYTATKYSVEYRLTIKHPDETTSNYSEDTLKTYHSQVLHDGYSGLYESEDALRADVEAYKNYILSTGQEGDTVLGEKLYVNLEPQVSFVLMDQKTGEVKAISGGRGTKNTSLSLNRATNTVRQPGSAFKVLAAFAPAIDSCGATLATTYYDAPYTVGTKTFRNWYKYGYLGYSSIRDGIEFSMNIVAVKCLMETVTPQLGVEYCKNFGITSLTDTDYNAATALGGLTYGVSNLEITGAYAAIANGGVYNKPVFFSKILDHNGKVLIDNTTPESKRVLKEDTAFLLTDAMVGVVQANRKWARSGVNVNSTSTRCQIPGMSVAGKSGTTSSNNDLWFVGYTPYYTAGIWTGYDDNQNLGEDGAVSYHKTIWQKIMARVSSGQADIGFTKPASIETAEVCRKSGKLAIPGVCTADPRGNAVYTEYFAAGTVPTEKCDHHTTIKVCAESGQKPTAYCTNLTTRVIMIVPESSEATDDSVFTNPGTCEIHNGATIPSSPSGDTTIVGPSNQIGPGYQSDTAGPSTGLVTPKGPGT